LEGRREGAVEAETSQVGDASGIGDGLGVLAKVLGGSGEVKLVAGGRWVLSGTTDEVAISRILLPQPQNLKYNQTAGEPDCDGKKDNI
jgi:hypothetical protein